MSTRRNNDCFLNSDKDFNFVKSNGDMVFKTCDCFYDKNNMTFKIGDAFYSSHGKTVYKIGDTYVGFDCSSDSDDSDNDLF